MKNIIIISFSVILGVYIFGLIMADSNSVRSAGNGVMKLQIEQMELIP